MTLITLRVGGGMAHQRRRRGQVDGALAHAMSILELMGILTLGPDCVKRSRGSCGDWVTRDWCQAPSFQ